MTRNRATLIAIYIRALSFYILTYRPTYRAIGWQLMEKDLHSFCHDRRYVIEVTINASVNRLDMTVLQPMTLFEGRTLYRTPLTSEMGRKQEGGTKTLTTLLRFFRLVVGGRLTTKGSEKVCEIM